MSGKTVKSLLLVTVTGLVVMLGGAFAAFLVVDDDKLITWLVDRIETVSDTTISYAGEAGISRGLAPVLTLHDLEVADREQRFSVHTSRLGIQVSLLKVFIGRLDIPLLEIGDTQVKVSGDKTANTPGDGAWFKNGVDLSALRLRPVVHQVQVASIAVTRDDDSWKLGASQVSKLSLKLQTDEDIPALSADFDIVGKVMHIDASLPNFHRALKSGKLPFSVNVVGPLASSALVGELDFTQADATVQAQLHAHAKDLSVYPLDIEDLQLPGSLNLEGTLSGKLEAPSLQGFSANWQGPSASHLTITGSIGNAITFEQVDLKLAGKLENTDWLRPALPESLPVSGLNVESALGGSRERLQFDGFKLTAHTTESLNIDLHGDLQLAKDPDETYGPQNIKAKIKFDAPTTRAARFIVFDDVPEFGAINCSADVTSTQGHAAIENIDLKTEHAEGIEVVLSGAIKEFPLSPSPNRGYDLDVTIVADKADSVTAAVGLDLPLTGPMQLAFRIQGDTPALQLNAINMNAGSKKALNIKADGHMLFGDWSRDDPLESISLGIQAYSHSTEAFERFAHDDVLPVMGGLNIRGRVQTAAGKHRIDGFSMQTVEATSVQVAMTGSAADLVLFPVPSLAGIDLEVRVDGDDTSDLNAFFDLATPWIPAAGAFEIRSTVTGTSKSVAIEQTRITAGSKEVVQLNAHGRLGSLDADSDPASGWAFYNSDLKLEVASDSSQALLKAMGYHSPAFGPLTASAVIHDKDKSLGLDALRVVVGMDPKDPVVDASGQVSDLYNGKDVDIDVKLNIDGRNLAAFADQHSLKDLAPLSGDLKVTDKPGALGIQALKVNSSHETLTVDIDGSFSDFSKPETLALRARVNARDLALVGALFDQEWPDYAPFELSSEIGRDGHRMHMKAAMRAGQKGLDAQLHGDFSAQPPKFAGKLTAHQLSLPDFYVKAAEHHKKRKKDKKKQDKPVFSREPLGFDLLTKFDLALVIDVDTFDRTDSEAESADITVNLKDGLLQVKPAVLKYPKGQLDLELFVDARNEPKLTYKAAGKNLNPWLGLSGGERDAKDPVKADVDIGIHLAATGRSPHELVSTLDGDIYMTIKDGKMSRSFSDLLFIDIVGWTASLVKDQRYTDLNCGLLDLRIDQGMVSTDAFFIDTQAITVTGEGTVDLGKEKVDYVFLPKKKSRIILKAEPVKVTGSLADPQVKAIPVKSAALTFGTLLFAPYVFVGMTASDYLSGKVIDGDKGTTPCATYERKHTRTDVLDSGAMQE